MVVDGVWASSSANTSTNSPCSTALGDDVMGMHSEDTSSSSSSPVTSFAPSISMSSTTGTTAAAGAAAVPPGVAAGIAMVSLRLPLSFGWKR